MATPSASGGRQADAVSPSSSRTSADFSAHAFYGVKDDWRDRSYLLEPSSTAREDLTSEPDSAVVANRVRVSQTVAPSPYPPTSAHSHTFEPQPIPLDTTVPSPTSNRTALVPSSRSPTTAHKLTSSVVARQRRNSASPVTPDSPSHSPHPSSHPSSQRLGSRVPNPLPRDSDSTMARPPSTPRSLNISLLLTPPPEYNNSRPQTPIPTYPGASMKGHRQTSAATEDGREEDWSEADDKGSALSDGIVQEPLSSGRFTAASSGDPARKRRRAWIIAAVVAGSVVVGGAVGAGVGVSLSRKKSTLDSGSLSGQTAVSNSVGSVAPTSSVAVVVPSGSATATAGVATPSSTARRIVVFGASYCDNGHARAAQDSASLEPSPYFGGRHSNGIVWDEYLGLSISVAGANNTDMRNYAYSGAMVDNSLTYAVVPDTKSQIASYKADVASGLVSPLPTGGRTLIAIWVGLNPVMSIWSSTTSASASLPYKSISQAQTQITAVATALLAQISSLRAMNATADFLVLPLPPTEILPYAISSSNGNSAWLSLYTSLTNTYNAALSAGLATIGNTSTSTILTYDIPTLFMNEMATPSLVSGVTDVTHACMTTSECSTPSTHFWWDSIHMTTDAHKWVAAHVSPLVTSLWHQ